MNPLSVVQYMSHGVVILYVGAHHRHPCGPPQLAIHASKTRESQSNLFFARNGIYVEYLFFAHSSPGYGGEEPPLGGEPGSWCGLLEYQTALCHIPWLRGHSGWKVKLDPWNCGLFAEYLWNLCQQYSSFIPLVHGIFQEYSILPKWNIPREIYSTNIPHSVLIMAPRDRGPWVSGSQGGVVGGGPPCIPCLMTPNPCNRKLEKFWQLRHQVYISCFHLGTIAHMGYFDF